MRVCWQHSGVTDVPSLAAFYGQHPGARVMSVDGREFHGACSVCGMLVLGQDRYGENALHDLFCEACLYERA